MTGPQIVDLTPGDERLATVWPVVRQLREQLDDDDCAARYAAGHADGYRLTVLFDAGACSAAAGWRISSNLVHGRNLYVDDLVTAAERRSRGHGSRLLAHLVERARAQDCTGVFLDSGVQRHAAHRFYFREGFRITSYHFGRSLERE